MQNPFDKPEVSFEASLLAHYLKQERDRGAIGPDNPITGKKLAHHFAVSERDVQTWVKELRDAGEPVALSKSGKGYFWALSEEELEHWFANIDSRIENLKNTRNAVKFRLAQNAPQLTMQL